MAMVSLAVVAVPVLVFAPEGFPRLKALQRELADRRANNEQLRRDVAQLRSDVRRLREDPGAVERIARDELGMVRRNEVVFQFSGP